MSHLFLIGFMGAGKSTVARLVAQRLSRPCLDLDDEIERSTGVPIAEMFSVLGEEAFRTAESETLEALASHEPSVVACGGGIVVRPRNQAALKRLGTVVYLQVTPGEALARIGDVASRPLLAGSSGVIAATALLQAREALYSASADMIIDTAGKSAEQVAELVVANLIEKGL